MRINFLHDLHDYLIVDIYLLKEQVTEGPAIGINLGREHFENYRKLSKTIENYRKLSKTIENYRKLSKTIKKHNLVEKL